MTPARDHEPGRPGEPHDGDAELGAAFLAICREEPGPEIDERILSAAARARELDRPAARLRRFVRRRKRTLMLLMVAATALVLALAFG